MVKDIFFWAIGAASFSLIIFGWGFSKENAESDRRSAFGWFLVSTILMTIFLLGWD